MGLQKLTTNLADALGQHIVFLSKNFAQLTLPHGNMPGAKMRGAARIFAIDVQPVGNLRSGGPSLSAKNPRDFRIKDGPRLMKSLQKMVKRNKESPHRHQPFGSFPRIICHAHEPKIIGSQVDRT